MYFKCMLHLIKHFYLHPGHTFTEKVMDEQLQPTFKTLKLNVEIKSLCEALMQ
jgi:hypothetical protein